MFRKSFEEVQYAFTKYKVALQNQKRNKIRLSLCNTFVELNKSDVQVIVIYRWNKLFKETKYKPIDIHTLLLLWSRKIFKEENK